MPDESRSSRPARPRRRWPTAAARRLGVAHPRRPGRSASRTRTSPAGFESIVGGHPVPTADERSARAAGRWRSPRRSPPTRRLLVLLSGGASALMAVPADGITLDDKRATTERLLRGGRGHSRAEYRAQAPVGDQGRLARGRAPRRVPHARHLRRRRRRSRASSRRDRRSPTRSTLRRTRSTCSRASAGTRPIRRAVVARLRRGAAGADRGAGDARSPATRGWRARRTTVIGSRRDAMAGAAAAAAALGYHVLRARRRRRRRGARSRPSRICAPCWRAPPRLGRPACIVSSGETTVHVTGGGQGRAQSGIRARRRRRCSRDRAALGVVASVGTDGIDGPTDAAGAIADSTTIARAAAAGLLARAASLRQQCLRVFRRARRSHPHRSDRHERRRPPSNSVSLNSDVFTRSSPRAHARAGAPPRRHARAPPGSQSAQGRPDVVQAPHQVARRLRRSHSDSRASASACPKRWTSTSAGCRRTRPATASSAPSVRSNRAAATSTFPARISTKRCTATASSCASSGSRTAAAPKGASSASSSAPTRRSSAATTATTTAWATSCRSIAAC